MANRANNANKGSRVLMEVTASRTSMEDMSIKANNTSKGNSVITEDNMDNKDNMGSMAAMDLRIYPSATIPAKILVNSSKVDIKVDGTLGNNVRTRGLMARNKRHYRKWERQ
ncbi:Hypothetical predicted protein [Pelobates cultripes]|uniref:Uncharacterized protein n=1 Tax=Pelobates cultripes TaxID=61616 RepID=A0AAD1WI66_PELCU|nr:Hypothetical predicted protein [Pelobates cultripes]